MDTFPIMLDVRGRPAVVVGGGPVGLRKAGALLAAGAKVRIVAESLAAEAPTGAQVIAESYRPEHLAGAMLVFACTDNRKLNAAIAEDARQAGALVNAADQPDQCDFHTPAVIREGELVVAIGTGGAAPALAGRLKQELAQALPANIGQFVSLLGEIRDQLKGRLDGPDDRAAILKGLSGPEGLSAFEETGPQGVYELLKRLMKGR